MIPPEFDYAAPATVEEALALLAEHGDEAKVMSGGQSLLPVLRMRLNAPGIVVDISRIEEIKGITDTGDAIRIGAGATYQDVLDSDLISEHLALLHTALTEVADAQIRHRGTVCGALVHADPAGDVGAPVLALEGRMVIQGQDGERTVEASDFFVDLFETAVGEDELLVAVEIPKHTGWGAHYEKFVRVSHQWAIIGIAAAVRVEGGTIAEARVGLTNMGATPLRATAVEEALVGKEATEEAVAEACAQVGEGTDPPSDLNGQADYRKHVAGVLTRRAVLAAAGA
ncbi:Carbon monoxide dehydrogenase medium chain [Serinicoccus hydrothermalis]|uniref:Carbon monoxide dehydrogenase medium chain n=1 Tax=Serinicoccus hydrothermalis TaxID=1758689 RepID=A0A1B1N8G0_9MICO|nr:xanthine dehydrogenase family protein subunit M [Serinicoccus hydrothermalis]ANS77709.1 Carbon monoxide dehydrogenase medium chain [Serinicoccus hydrothermalis]